MKNLKLSIFLIFLANSVAFGQEANFSEEEIAIDKFTDGTLTMPSDVENPSLLIFIQGSGLTNRDGNQSGMQSDFAKKIAHQLAGYEIASFRFDKRSLKAQELSLESIIFADFITDVENILRYFKKENKFRNYIIAGHSQGSLIGMIAAKDHADAFISLAGAGESIDRILVEQLTKQLPQFKAELQRSFDEIKKMGSTKEYPEIFSNMFNPSAQKFLASWINYDPSEEIAKLKIPVLVINGTNDAQVKEEQAKILHNAALNSELVLLENMNHVFREIASNDLTKNYQTYNNPELPLHPELIPVLNDFIKNLERKEK
ncbi:alpha/beta hydrolase family protein [Salegentibacter maritimus]|uniref:Alpha/beta hydrolase n=1 Tax=Salegentibacter maritimus TaxID=2794347 RepID=A0ABS0TBR5_9FLAO|nr:alpha/beta hydrolase [Salegentibacter maritimus]MBI6118476.1 alpha/beta hydrolase [Salegentibacter maritimus]